MLGSRSCMRRRGLVTQLWVDYPAAILAMIAIDGGK